MAVVFAKAGEVKFSHQLSDASRYKLFLTCSQLDAEFIARKCGDCCKFSLGEDERPDLRLDIVLKRWLHCVSSHLTPPRNTPSRSRIRPTRPSPRIAPPAIPGMSLTDSPSDLITTSCLPMRSSTMRQNDRPVISATMRRLSEGSSD